MKIAVPYKSQWDDDAKTSRGDCGIVAAAMICGWAGVNTSPDELIRQAGLKIGAHSYSFSDIIKAASVVGVTLVYRADCHWQDIRAELAAGRPVITLLRYGVISGNQDDFDGSHFWVEIGCSSDLVFVNDPDWWRPLREEGADRTIPLAEFENSIGESLIPTGNKAYQSLFVVEK